MLTWVTWVYCACLKCSLQYHTKYNLKVCIVTKVKINAYADDQQLYSSDTDHLALHYRLGPGIHMFVFS